MNIGITGQYGFVGSEKMVSMDPGSIALIPLAYPLGRLMMAGSEAERMVCLAESVADG